MKFKFSDWWRWGGTINRGHYLLAGIVLMAIKYNLDRAVAYFGFHRAWSLINYLQPDHAASFVALAKDDSIFYATMVAMALPFIWIGVMLTFKRLRAIGLPLWLVVLFFIPAINLLFFAVLSVLPSRSAPVFESPPRGWIGRFLDWVIPKSAWGSAAMSLFLTVFAGLFIAYFGTSVLERYGWGLFVGLPFALGMGAALIHGYHEERTCWECLAVAIFSMVLFGAWFLAFGFEGIGCLIMAAPLGLVIALLGGFAGYVIQGVCRRKETATALLILLTVTPAMLGMERMADPEAPLFAVRTSVEINAPPSKVWKHVVSFTELPAPREWLFRAGIAYPLRAEIIGHGKGAKRFCVFSTGSFVEPIEVWDEPRLLKFSVTSNPPPMEEWTPYREIHPPHLNGFLASKGGQFLLTPLADGRTRLEGTTWYHHHMWPAGYWKLWSDFIIHRIHLRVLQHVKDLTERESNG